MTTTETVAGPPSNPPRYTDQELLRAALRQDFYSFVRKVFETVSPGDTFSPNWSVEAVTYALEKVASGKTTRLIINIPPRHLKSICASVALPAFVLGQDPTKRIICVSYADDLAKKFSNDCRAVMRSNWYRRIFPATITNKAKDTETEVQTTKQGYRLATSVGGSLTGRGGDLIIIDDPIKPQDAQSKAVREKTTQWYENTLLSRLDDKQKGGIVLVMQRLHMDDLTAHLLAKGGFEHLCLPAIGEKQQVIPLGPKRFHIRKVNEVLDPQREPREALDTLRKGMTPLVFSAQYREYYVTSWDTAMKSSELADYSVGTVWHVQDRGQKIYLVDLVRGRFEFPDLVAAAVKLNRRWGFHERRRYNYLIIEDKGSGTSLIQPLKKERIYVHPYNIKLEGDKTMRLSAQAAQFASGLVHFPVEAPWLDDLMEELLAFPGVKHDDQVDSVSQALSFITWLEANTIKCGRKAGY